MFTFFDFDLRGEMCGINEKPFAVGLLSDRALCEREGFRSYKHKLERPNLQKTLKSESVC